MLNQFFFSLFISFPVWWIFVLFQVVGAVVGGEWKKIGYLICRTNKLNINGKLFLYWNRYALLKCVQIYIFFFSRSRSLSVFTKYSVVAKMIEIKRKLKCDCMFTFQGFYCLTRHINKWNHSRNVIDAIFCGFGFVFGSFMAFFRTFFLTMTLPSHRTPPDYTAEKCFSYYIYFSHLLF